MRSKKYSEEIVRVCVCEHRTADEILQILKKKNPKLGQATIYRTLKYLTKEGLLNKIDGLGNNAHYEATQKNHAHLVNETNGEIIDIEIPEDVTKLLKIPKNFDIKRIDIRICGTYKNK